MGSLRPWGASRGQEEARRYHPAPSRAELRIESTATAGRERGSGYRERESWSQALHHIQSVSGAEIPGASFYPGPSLLDYFSKVKPTWGGYTIRCVSQQKLADVRKRLIFERLSRREEFEEPHCTPGRVQMSTYVENVRLVWPNLDEALILNTLPVRSNKRRENSLPTVRFIMKKS